MNVNLVPVMGEPE
uniref:Uncharacterized protein n=1 Tax=Arundo donax TaxID=35708 RepID=A0A0A8ZFY5_ARUDO